MNKGGTVMAVIRGKREASTTKQLKEKNRVSEVNYPTILEEDFEGEENLEPEEDFEEGFEGVGTLETEENPVEETSARGEYSHKGNESEVTDIQPLYCKVSTRIIGNEALFSIVSTQKCGHRITISRDKVLDRIGVTETVQVAYSTDSQTIILAKDLNGQDYKLRKSHGKAVIYNSQLVKMLTKLLNLDFSSCSSVSFSNVEIKEHSEFGKIALIRVRRDA